MIIKRKNGDSALRSNPFPSGADDSTCFGSKIFEQLACITSKHTEQMHRL